MRKMLFTLGVVCLFAIQARPQTPRLELFGGYSYGRFNPGGFLTGNNDGKGLKLSLPSGWDASGQININRWIGFAMEGASNGGSNAYEGATVPIRHRITTIMAGPQINFRTLGPLAIFAHGLFGAAHGRAEVKNVDGSVVSTDVVKQTRPAFAFGGGIDVKLWHMVALRAVQLDLVRTNFSNFACASPTDPACSNLAPGRQTNLRISTGMVFRLGGGR
jgi:opacity protein-like surface antigen